MPPEESPSLWMPDGSRHRVRRDFPTAKAVQREATQAQSGATNDDVVRQMRMTRSATQRKTAAMQHSASGGFSSMSSSQVSLASSKPRDPMFYWRENNLPYLYYEEADAVRIRDYANLIYLTHPVIASCIDTYSLWPLTGMHLECLAGETRVLTDLGTFPIRELAGSTHRIITRGGKWAEAKFDSYGVQDLRKITLSKNGRTKVIHATPGHRWFLNRHRTLSMVGERNPGSKLTWGQVEGIRSRYTEMSAASGLTQAQLADKYEISLTGVQKILRDSSIESWNGHDAQLGSGQLATMRREYQGRTSILRILSQEFSISEPMVSSIVRGNSWTQSTSVKNVQVPIVSEVTTDDLRPGDRLTSTKLRSRIKSGTVPCTFAVAQGMVFGDGSQDYDFSAGGGSYIDLIGAKDYQMLKFFNGSPTAQYAEGQTRVSHLPRSWKRTLPDLKESTSFLYGWLSGYFAADGTVSKAGACSISCVDRDNLTYVRSLCSTLGIQTTAPYRVVRTKVNKINGKQIGEVGDVLWMLHVDGRDLTESFFHVEEHRQRWLKRMETSRESQTDWVVQSVERTPRTETVYCAQVEGTQSFVLEDDILTGNCKNSKIEEFGGELFFDTLNYEDYLPSILKQIWLRGEAFPLGQFDDVLGVWEDDQLINPNDVKVIDSPFFKGSRFEMRIPESIREIVDKQEPRWEYQQLVRAYPDIVAAAQRGDYLPVDSTLMQHLALKLDDFHPRGVSILMRAFRSIYQEEMLNAATDAVASRLYTPLVLVKLGAPAADMGTDVAWVPTASDLEEFEAAMDMALMGDFRMLTSHFATDITSVFGREMMPLVGEDLERLMDRQLMSFGLSRSLLMGGADSQTFASDALNRDLVVSLLGRAQRWMKRFFRSRAEVVAEAQEHYDYEEFAGEKKTIYHDVKETDEETGEVRIVRKPKLLVPELHMDVLNLHDKEAERQFVEALVAGGVPISMETRMTNIPINLEDEWGKVHDERVRMAVEAESTRKDTYLGLKQKGLGIREDLLDDYEPHAEPQEDATVASSGGDLPLPSDMGAPPDGQAVLSPTPEDYAAAEAAGEMPPEAPPGTIPFPASTAPQMIQVPPANPQRPPESDQERARMPKASKRQRTPRRPAGPSQGDQESSTA